MCGGEGGGRGVEHWWGGGGQQAEGAWRCTVDGVRYMVHDYTEHGARYMVHGTWCRAAVHTITLLLHGAAELRVLAGVSFLAALIGGRLF